MTKLLEIREQIKFFYSKAEWIITPVAKLLAAFISLNVINSRMGYMPRLDNFGIVMIVALMCAFLPTGAILLFCSVFCLLHLYSLSLEVAVLGMVVFLLIYLLYLRFAPGESLVVMGTTILCAWKIPYLVPIVMGLVGGPASAISVGCGVLAYAFLDVVTDNAANISTMADEETIVRLKLVVDALLANKQMLILILVFAITTIVVYVIRRLPVDHAWTIAIIAGVIFNMVLLLVADLFYELVEFSFVRVFLVSLLALVIGMVLEFFRFQLDYGHTERVQFEDDEYYYYVKAVPKMMVPQSSRTIKRINRTSYVPEAEEEEDVRDYRPRSRRGGEYDEAEEYEEFHEEFSRRRSQEIDRELGFGFDTMSSFGEDPDRPPVRRRGGSAEEDDPGDFEELF